MHCIWSGPSSQSSISQKTLLHLRTQIRLLVLDVIGHLTTLSYPTNPVVLEAASGATWWSTTVQFDICHNHLSPFSVSPLCQELVPEETGKEDNQETVFGQRAPHQTSHSHPYKYVCNLPLLAPWLYKEYGSEANKDKRCLWVSITLFCKNRKVPSSAAWLGVQGQERFL